MQHLFRGAPASETAQPGRACHPVAGHDQGKGIGVASLSHRPGSSRVSQGLSQISIGFCFPIRNFSNPFPDASLKRGPLFDKWRFERHRKFLKASREKFPKQIGEAMAAGVLNAACRAVVFFEPLFGNLLPFGRKRDMDREVAEADGLDADFLESERKAEVLPCWSVYCCSHAGFLLLIEKAAALDKKGKKNLPSAGSMCMAENSAHGGGDIFSEPEKQ
jgi:hypothetical protein